MQYDLDKKEADIEKLSADATSDQDLYKALISGVKSKDDTIRSNSFRILQIISEDNPELIYPEWHYFQQMLHSNNSYHVHIAIYILANLTKVDDEKRFEKIFDDYFGILGGNKVMNASHVALNTPTIIKYKPELELQIIDQLLNIENVHQGRQKELVKAYVIEALLKIYPNAQNQDHIYKFVKVQLKSSSPKTRDMAMCFLDRC